MSLYADLITQLGSLMGISLHADARDTCRIEFTDKVTLQIDLDEQGERLLVGSVLGQISSGTYRNQVFKQALKVNALSNAPRGILAYSERLSSLILFEYLPINVTDGQKLHQFVQLFHAHAKVWIDCLAAQDLPQIEQETSKGSGMFGMKS